MAENISFRQVGREIPGKLCKGNIIDAFNRLTQPSIPTKSEQVLTAIEKQGGFGSSADRFHYKPETLNPGPGEYADSSFQNPSIGKRGYGSLTSKQTRFKRFEYNTPVPGPGNYDPIRRSAILSLKYSSQKSQPLTIPSESPAPGQYEPKQFESTKIPMTSVFKSKSKKAIEESSSVPPPGTYDIEPEKMTRSFNVPFKNSVKARRYQINLYDPHSEVPRETSPGPGEYSVEETPKLTSKPSSMFTIGESDRFGSTKRIKRVTVNSPGPGTYYSVEEAERLPVSSSVFMSESERNWLTTDRKPPGPAFYKPSVIPKKKSFHLNSYKKWVN